MYNAFFGFEKAPFASTPDPAFFFPSNHHDAALRGLQLSVEARMGLISLVGDEGTGKTLVLECLRSSLGANIPCAFIRDSRISFDRFLETIASDLNLDLLATTKSARQVFLALVRLATQQAQSGRTIVLMVDEAHNLPADVFTEIIHTASVQHGKVKAIQTVFAGRPELQARLAALNPDRIKQRAILSRSLHPFTARETQEYVQFRLASAGLPKQTVFPREALEEIYDLSQGLAPAIHTLCERLLQEAFSAKSNVCTQEIRDRVFRKPLRNLSQTMADSPIIVAAARVDTSLLSPPPEPPPMQITLLRVAVDARRGSFLPRLLGTEDLRALLAPIRLPVALPRGRFAFAEVKFALEPIQPMLLEGCTRDSIPGRSMGLGLAISSIPVTGRLARLPQGAPAEPCPPRAPQLPSYKLVPLQRDVRLGPALAGGPAPAGQIAELFSHTLQATYPRAALQPASVIPCSRVPFTPIRTIKDDGRACTVLHTELSPLTSIPQPMHPTGGLLQATIILCSSVPLTPIRTIKDDGRAFTVAHSDLLPLTSIPQPMHPVAGLQPASIIPCSRVRLTPIRTIKDDGRAFTVLPANLSPLTSIPRPMHPTAGLQPASIIPCSRVPLTPIRKIKDDGRAFTVVYANLRPLTTIAQPMHPTAGLQPASIIPCSRVRLTPIQTIKNDGCASTIAHSDLSPLTIIFEPIHPSAGLQPGSIIPCSRVPLRRIQTIKYDVHKRSAAHAEPSPLTSVPQPMHPTTGLQAASIIPCPRMPFTPSRAGRHSALPPSPIRFVEMSNLIPVGRPAATLLSASLHPSAEVPNRLLPLAFSTKSVPPSVETPIGSYLSTPPSLQAHRPFSGLKPADPAKPSLLLPSTWIPIIAGAKNAWVSPVDTFTASRERLVSHQKPLLTVVIPILAALALYGTLPAMRAAADVPRQGLQRAHRAVLDRAAVALDENFRTGLHDWTDRGGSPPSWTSDASGFVRPGALALYRPSLGMVDYQMQFLGTIDNKGLSWVVRAADFNNYYAIRLTVLKPGPLPSIGVNRYAVIDGIPQKRFTTPLLMRAQADTVYHVRLDVQGDRFTLFVQDQPVDSWAEPRLGRGSIGFFSEKDARSRIASLHVRGHYDMLGRLYAFLMPSSVSNDR